VINLNIFEILQESEIRRLRAGRVRVKEYWIAIRDGNVGIHVLRSRLLNQWGSQTPPAHPRGSELFRTPYGERAFDLSRNDFEVPELGVAPTWPRSDRKVMIRLPRKPACVIRAPRNPYLSGVLEDEYKRFRLGYDVRKAIEREPWNLFIAAELLVPSTRTRELNDVSAGVKIVEMQLLRAETGTIEDLAALLKMPDAARQSPQPSLAVAA